ncbi:MAG: hypothetical protein ACJ714_13965 [Ornithinibacter sp.]
MSRRSGVLTSVCAAAVLVAGGLAGCSSGGGSAAAPASAATSAQASASAPASPSAPASAPASAGTASAPAGTTWVQAKSTGLRFAVPDDWKVFDATAVTEGKNKAMVTELTRMYQVDEKQLAQMFGQMDVMVMGPVENRFAPNVNVVPNGLSTLPAASDLAAELEKLGATTGTPRDVNTALGPAILVPYELSSGGNQVKGRSIVVEGPNGFATVTVSHITDKGADAVTSSVLTSISTG